MSFTSLEFLLFITVFTAGFMAIAKTRLFTPFLLVTSYIFYGYWDYRFCFLLAFGTLVDFYCGIRIADARSRPEARLYLYLSLGANLGMLFFFKYYNFFVDSAHTALASLGIEIGERTLSILLPVGISFYTFQNLSYSLDLYWKKLEGPERSLLRYAAFVAFFPQLVAGPIVRARDLLPQIQSGPRDVPFTMRFAGLEKIVWGFFLKIGLADNAAAVVDARFAQPEFYNALSHVIGLVCFSLQIYGDFAGYSLIAIGLAQIFGYTLPENFARPYFAVGVRDFWKRWHISLSSWLRDYLYVPLGGNRTRWIRTRNVVIVMLVSGIWHGAAWTFVVWGALHAALSVAEDGVRWLAARSPVPLGWLTRGPGKILLVGFMFMLITLTWLPFRAENMDKVWTILSIIAAHDFSLPSGMQQMTSLMRVAVIGSMVLLIDAMVEMGARNRYAGMNVLVRSTACSALLIVLLLFGSFGSRSFIYFQF